MSIYHGYQSDNDGTYSVCWHRHKSERAAANCPWSDDGQIVTSTDHRPYRLGERS